MAPQVADERPGMTGEDVVWLLSSTDALGVRVWIDGAAPSARASMSRRAGRATWPS
jgi:hypothetical protein